MKSFKSYGLIFFLLTTLIGCSEKSKTPTEFNMTLGGLSASGASEFAGGIILRGSNGSENFRIGVTPDKVSSFSMELPEGNWSFTAIGWLNDASEGIMTGQARCGFASSRIENSETTITLALSQADCAEGKIGTNNSLDTTLGAGLWFKRLDFISCLNPDGIAEGDLCNGPELNRLPGEASAVRIVFPGKANFNTSAGSLRSQCYPHEALSTGDFSSGLIPTTLRLPFLGTQKFPWSIETFSDVNCQDYETSYAMPDGLTGNQGVYRLVDGTPTDHLKLNFADNYIGKVGSIFDNLNLKDILPNFACGNNCYDSSTPSPSSFLGGSKDEIRDQIWQELGNTQRIDSNDIVGVDRASKTINDPGSAAGVTLFAPEGTGTAGNNTLFMIEDSGTDPINVSCIPNQVIISFDSTLATHIDLDMAFAVNDVGGECEQLGYEAQAESAGTVATNAIATNVQLENGTTAIIPTRKQEGNIQSIRRVLYGPIGVGLKSKGIETFQNLCDGSMDGIYEFNIPAGRVRMHLTTPSVNATLPNFATYSRTEFERKILLEVDGDIEEAFYFNCNSEQTVGAYLRYEYENSSYTVKQAYWDTTAAGDESLETGSQTVSTDTNELLRQSSFYMKFTPSTPTASWDAWLMNYHHSDDETRKAVGHYVAGTGILYTQKSSLVDGDTAYTSDVYSLKGTDQKWDVAPNTRAGLETPALTLDTPPTASNIYPTYKASDFEVMSNGYFWDYSF